MKATPAAPIGPQRSQRSAFRSRLAFFSSKGIAPPSFRLAGLLALTLTAIFSFAASSATAAPPAVTIDPASQVGVSAAHVSGTLDPADHETNYHFEFITDQAFQAANEQQRLTVSATAGTYTLSFAAQTTAPIAFNAAASELEAALNALSMIGGAGASVTVSGGPGDEAGSAPYTLTFGAALAATDVEQISSDASALSGGSQSANPETTVEGRPEGFQGANQAGNNSLPAGVGETPVETTLEGLLPNTTYHLRLYAENTGVEPIEHDEAIASTFTTNAAKEPILATQAATEVSYLRATLHGTLDPQGGNVNPTGPPGEEALPIYWYLQYRESPESGWNPGGEGTIAGAEAESSGPIPIQATLPPNALQPAKTYEVRVFAYYLSFSREASSPEPFPSFETLPVAKPSVSIEAVTIFSAHTAQLVGHVNPNAPKAKAETDAAEQEAFLTRWHFQCEPECPGLEGEVLAGKDPEEVPKEATGLIPGHNYEVSLIASNAGGTETAGPVEFTTEAEPPTIVATFATSVSETAATLKAKVNPGGAETSFHFEYLTAQQFEADGNSFGAGTTKAPEPDEAVGSDVEDHTVEATVTSLQPNTAYRYRIVATNEKSPGGGTVGPTKAFHTAAAAPISASCPNEALRRENNSTALPDCRAYEMVSPTEKVGFDAVTRPVFQQYPTQAAPSGDGIAYMGLGPFAGAQAGLFPNLHLSTRTRDGWQTVERTPPTVQGTLPAGASAAIVNYNFSEDLSQLVFKVAGQALISLPSGTEGLYNLFLRKADGSYSLINSAPPAEFAPESAECYRLELCFGDFDVPAFAGASNNFEHILFQENGSLVGTGAPGEFVDNLYESSGGQVQAVGVLPDEVIAPGGAAVGAGGFNPLFGGFFNVDDAISADGKRILFSATADGGAPDPVQAGLTELYDRIEGKKTIEISAPAPGATPANSTPQPAQYWNASDDGSLVFFTSSAELTTPSNTGTANNSSDLYRYNVDTETLTDLSVDTNPLDAETGAGVQGVVGTSDDGSYAYFVATGELIPGEGEDGQPNLYLSHGGQLEYITTLSGGDANDWTSIPEQMRSYVTPDGRHLALMSTKSLLTANYPEGYDNTDQITGEADSEVYTYSAEDGQLLCASCNPSGARPKSPSYIGAKPEYLASSPFHQPRTLSDSGDQLFFSSRDALSEDASGPFAKVYEYERAGAGSCTQQGGCLALIAPGAGENDIFLDAGANGRDVFFATLGHLVASDADDLFDVYDARVEGGFASAVVKPPCEGEGCLGPASGHPPSSSAASSAFNGPEEGPKHLKCGKGQRKRHGRCAAKKAKHHKARNGHKANNNRRAGK